MLLTGIVVSVPSAANAGGHHHNSYGNGRHNQTDVTVNSPTINRGGQNISNGNAGGINNIQGVVCTKRRKHCSIFQKIIVGR